MDRRNFLKSMGILAATAVSATSFAAMTQPNKYSEAIRLLDACRDIQDPKLSSARADLLLTHLRENFPAPEASEANIAAARVVLYQNKENLDEAGIRGIPPSVADAIYPIALFRLGLLLYKLPIEPDLMKNFDWFHKTYGLIIMQGSTPKTKTQTKTAQDLQNEALTQLNKETAWSQEDMKLYNIKGQA